MKKTMKAFRLVAPCKTQWCEVPVPEIGPDDALIRVTCVAPCNTDVHQLEQSTIPTLIGHTLGHEAVGIVEQVGANVKDFKLGERVLVPVTWSDYKTYKAQDVNGCGGAIAGKFNQPHTPYQSEDAYEGRFSEYCQVQDADLTLAKIPDSVSDTEAVLVSDLPTTSLPGVLKCNITWGDTVVILGIGPIGLTALQGVKLRGAGRIICVGHRELTKKLALEYGATDIVDYKEGDVYEQIKSIVGDEDIDSVLICSDGDASEQTNLAFRLVKWGGVVSNLSFWDKYSEISIKTDYIFYGGKDKAYYTTMVEDGRYINERYLKMIQYKRLDTSKMATHEFYGWNKLEEAYQLMMRRDPNVIKPVVHVEPFDD